MKAKYSLCTGRSHRWRRYSAPGYDFVQLDVSSGEQDRHLWNPDGHRSLFNGKDVDESNLPSSFKVVGDGCWLFESGLI